jgi:hypothetical protein
MNKLFYCLLLIFGIHEKLFSQENEAEWIVDKQVNWVPGELHASPNTLAKIVQYNGHYFSWNLRGVNTATTIVDGVNWEGPLKKNRLYELYNGFQNELHISGTVINGGFSENGYLVSANVNYLNSDILKPKRTILLRTGFSNTINSNSLHFFYNNALQKSKWQYGIGFTMQQAPPGIFANGFKKANGFIFVFSKQFNNTSKIKLSFIWNNAQQGKSATTVNEMFLLTNKRTYQPNWGWLHQQLYFPSTKQTNAPILTINYVKQLGENTIFKISNAIIAGTQYQTSLGWNNAADPRPDYYRYLPSYSKDSALRKSLEIWYKQHPEQLQIQFDKLEKINQNSKDGSAFYIVNQQNEKIFLTHGTISISNSTSSNFAVQFGTHYAMDQVRYDNTLNDLLGGKYFNNYNNWINDDGSILSYQNDILHPDRKIKGGETWGPAYTMKAFQIHPWLQIEKEGPILATKLAISSTIESIQRIGHNQNGLFPLSSKGESRKLINTSWDIKASLMYKLNGRANISSLFFTQWEAPIISQLYINPEMHSNTNPYMLSILHNGLDMTFHYSAPIVKFSTSLYWQQTMNQTIQKMFYHDGYAEFVYGLVGHIKEENTGIETSIETDIISNCKISFVTTLQKSKYSNNPNYQLLNVNDLLVKESGLLHLNQLPSTSSPEIVNGLSIQYAPNFYLRFNLTILYAHKRPINIDYFRRSDIVKNRIDGISWSRITQVDYLKDNSVVNASLFKTVPIKINHHPSFFNIGLSVRNLLDATIPIIAYEQTRFDYIHFDASKYAPKYLLDQGVAYSLHIQLQIQ